jgi:hypothetical protein
LYQETATNALDRLDRRISRATQNMLFANAILWLENQK